MNKPVYILVNPNAQQGKAWKRWLKIRSQVMQKLPAANEIIIENGFNLDSVLMSVPWNTGSHFISAGGDGSLNFLVNALLKKPEFDKSVNSVGAIGLGSSNDFHKPFQRFIEGIPTRMNIENPACWHDTGRVRYIDAEGNQKEKYFIINASFGATAQGNWNFNNPGPVLRWLKKNNTGAAINYTSLSTILSFRNTNCSIQYDGIKRTIPVSNINILKTPFVAGSLHYSQSIQPGDGKMGLNICYNMSRMELIQTLMGLQRGKFTESHKKISTYSNHFVLNSEQALVFECDGETDIANSFEISLIPNAIQILSS